MTTNLHLIPTLLIAAASVAGAAVVRRAARRERPDFLPWLLPWGVLCSIPALLYLCLCIPAHDESLRLLNESGFESGWEMLAGASGVLPGLLYDMIAERLEKHPNDPCPSGLPPWLLRTLLIVVELLVVMLPYQFIFATVFEAPLQTRIEDLAESSASVPDASSPQAESPDPAESTRN